VERKSGQPPAGILKELGYGRTGEFDNGKWKTTSKLTKSVLLYYGKKSDLTEQEMTDLIKKLIFDIAKANSISAYKNDITNKDNQKYFEQLLELMQETEGLESFHYRSEDKGIVFYKGDELPLYQPGTEYFCFEDKTRKTTNITLKVRYMNTDLFNELSAQEFVQVNLNDYWLYHVVYDITIKDSIDEALRAAIINSGNGKQRVSRDWLLACIKESTVQNLDKILRCTLAAEGEWVKYLEINSKLNMSGLTTVWNTRNLKHFLEYDNGYKNKNEDGTEDGTVGRVKLISNRNMVKSVLDDLGA
jgi:outer membrane lipoprotein-sorting protein